MTPTSIPPIFDERSIRKGRGDGGGYIFVISLPSPKQDRVPSSWQILLVAAVVKVERDEDRCGV